jgi:hypothetical protein
MEDERVAGMESKREIFGSRRLSGLLLGVPRRAIVAEPASSRRSLPRLLM